MTEQEAKEAMVKAAIQKFKDENLDNPKSALPTDVRLMLTKGIRLGIDAAIEHTAAEVEAVKRQLAEAEFVIGGMHHLGTSTLAVNVSNSLNDYLEKYGTKKPTLEGQAGGEG